MQSTPRVVIPPMSRTRGKTLSAWHTSHNFDRRKRITQPSGAATPRNSDTHKRIAVPKALCVLWEHPRPRPKSGKVRRSDTRPGDVRERAERSEGSDSTPSETLPVSACKPLCAILLAKASCTHFHPQKRMWAVCAGGVEVRVTDALEALI